MKITLLALFLSTGLLAADSTSPIPSPSLSQSPSVPRPPSSSPCMVNVETVNAKVTPDKKGGYNSAKLEAWLKAIREGHPQKTPVNAATFKTEFDSVSDMPAFKQLYQKYGAYMCTPDYAGALFQVILKMERKELTKSARASLKKLLGDETFWMPSLVSIGKRIDILRTAMRGALIAASGNATMQLNRSDQAVSQAYMGQMQSMHGFNGPGGTNQAIDFLQIAKRDFADSFKYSPDFYKWIAENL